MKRFLVLTLTFLTIATLVLGLRWRNRGAFAKVHTSSPEAPTNDHNPLSRLDRRAKEAKSGDPESIRALADEIFTSTLPEREAQNPLVEDVKERLVQAELDHKGQGKQQQSMTKAM